MNMKHQVEPELFDLPVEQLLEGVGGARRRRRSAWQYATIILDCGHVFSDSRRTTPPGPRRPAIPTPVDGPVYDTARAVADHVPVGHAQDIRSLRARIS